MICNDARELISPFLDGLLVQDELEAFKEHLEACPVCTQELQISRRVMTALREIGEIELQAPADFSSTLMSRLKENAASGIKWKQMRQVAGCVAASLLLAAVVKYSGQVPVRQIAQLPIQEQTSNSRVDTPTSNPTTSNIQETDEGTITVASADSPSASNSDSTREQSEIQKPSYNDTTTYSTSAQLTGNRDCVIVSTFLKINVSDSLNAEDAARQIASQNGASIQSLGQQTSDGKLCLVDTITVDSSNAQDLLDSLSALGSIISRQEQRADLTDRYSQLSAQLITLKNQRAVSKDPAQVEQLEKQIAKTEKQLRSWVEQSSSQTIVIWLYQ